MKYKVWLLLILSMFVVFSFVRIWPKGSIMGEGVYYVNFWNHIAGCYKGDVQYCDYDPLDNY